MPLLSVIISVAIVGVIVWAIETLLPMNPTIKRLLEVIIVLAVAIWALQMLGVLGGHAVRVN